MRRRIALGLLCVLLLSGSQGRQDAYTGDGWGSSNITEGGYITKAEDGCYFFTEKRNIGEGLFDGEGLYRMDQEGTVTLLRSGMAYEINVVGDWVYFIKGSPGPICRISTNGRHFSVINRNYCDNLHVNPSCMVYRDRGHLCIADENGRSGRVLADHILSYVVHNDTIIFVQYHSDQDGIYQIGLDGSNRTRLSDTVPISLTSNGQHIYYSVPEGDSSFGETGGSVYQIDENGATARLPVEDLCWNMNVTEDYIFYRNQSKKGSLYRMDLDGTNQVRLLETNCADINVVGDLVLFRDISSGLCSIRYDGSGLMPWAGKIEDDPKIKTLLPVQTRA